METLYNVSIIRFLTNKRSSYHELNHGKCHPFALVSSPFLLVSVRTEQLPLLLVGPSVRQNTFHHHSTLQTAQPNQMIIKQLKRFNGEALCRSTYFINTVHCQTARPKEFIIK